MQYEVVNAPDLETLNKAVSQYLKLGWKLKNNIYEHVNGFAQELMRSPMESVYQLQRIQKRRKRSWIDLN